MTDAPASLASELGRIAGSLRELGVPFALAGGLAVSIRGEVRFTRDVDLVVAVPSDENMERLVRELSSRGYEIAALVEHEERRRLSTVRLRALPSGVHVDLLAASSGIEAEIVEAATWVQIESVGAIPVALAEDLLALKVLSVSERRPQDRLDAHGLVLSNPALDVARTRRQLELIQIRGFHRDQDLLAKLAALLAEK